MSKFKNFYLPLFISAALLTCHMDAYASSTSDDGLGAPAASSSSPSTSLLSPDDEAKINALTLTAEQKQQAKKQIKEKQDLLYDILSQTMEAARKANYTTIYGTPMDEIDLKDIIRNKSLKKGLNIRFSENVLHVNHETHTYTRTQTFQVGTSFSIEGHTITTGFLVHNKENYGWCTLLPHDMSVIKPSSSKS